MILFILCSTECKIEQHANTFVPAYQWDTVVYSQDILYTQNNRQLISNKPISIVFNEEYIMIGKLEIDGEWLPGVNIFLFKTGYVKVSKQKTDIIYDDGVHWIFKK